MPEKRGCPQIALFAQLPARRSAWRWGQFARVAGVVGRGAMRSLVSFGEEAVLPGTAGVIEPLNRGGSEGVRCECETRLEG